jgi:kinesin family protein 11
MSGLPRPGPPLKRNTTSMRPPTTRPPHMARGRSATPMLDGRSSRAESVASARAPRSSPLKRKEREFEAEEGHETNINVVVRCRGRNDREVRENSGVVVTTNGIKGSTVDLSMGPSALGNKTYQFDKVFSPAADQTMVFDEVVSPILDEVRWNKNATSAPANASSGSPRLQLHHFCIRSNGHGQDLHHDRRHLERPPSPRCRRYHTTRLVRALHPSRGERN